MNKVIAFVALTVFLGAPLVHAADLRGGEQISVAENERISENLYIGGAQVTVSGTLERDVVVGGGMLVVNGTVAGDVLAGGGDITLLERVEGDVRVAGGQVTIVESVAGDVVALGGSVSILSGAVVGGDVIVVGGVVTVDGTVNGNVRAVAGELTINGLVAGNVNARIGEKVSFGDNAAIGGDFLYRAAHSLEVPENVVAGKTTFIKFEQATPQVSPAALAGIGAGFAFFQFVIFAIATIVFLLVLPRFSVSIGEAAVASPWKNLGIGFVVLIMVPLFALVLLISIFGMYLAGVVFVGYMFMVAVAKALSGIVLGAFLSHWIKKETRISWKWALLGVFTIEVLALIPVIGWVFLLALFLITFGTLCLAGYEMFRAEHA